MDTAGTEHWWYAAHREDVLAYSVLARTEPGQVYEFPYRLCYLDFRRCTNFVHLDIEEGTIMPLPTWNGQPAEHQDIPKIQPDAFETLRAAMAGPSVHRLTSDQLLHLVEAASHLELMIEWTRLTAIPAARAGGASWAQLGAAMGVSRSTAQYRYERAAKEWADD
ncbi:hypothetical protein ACFXI3_00430 [Amycolatopsis sp. NPDC059235]